MDLGFGFEILEAFQHLDLFYCCTCKHGGTGVLTQHIADASFPFSHTICRYPALELGVDQFQTWHRPSIRLDRASEISIQLLRACGF